MHQNGSWSFGTAVITAPRVEGSYPEGWLFIAHKTDTGWQVGLEGTERFRQLAQAAPSDIMKSHEKKAFAAANEVKALAEQRTGLQLPFAQGATWYMTGGPHGWAGSDRPYSSMDLSGGDQKVVAARSGNVYTMCSNNLGWIRVVHDNGYSTDYYHLWDNIKPADGTRMPARSSVTPAPMSPVVVARTGAMSISPSSITAVMCRYMKKR